MLFYKTNMTRRVRVHPMYCGKKHDPIKVARKVLKQDIRQNPFSPEYGYIIDRIYTNKIEDGICLPQSGMIEFVATFEAILLYPVKGEVLDAVVESVTKTGIIFRYVCIYGIVRSYCLDEFDHFNFEELDVIPEEEKIRSGTMKEGVFRSQKDSEKIIEKGSVIRVRVIKTTLGDNGFFLIGSMSTEFLGPVKSSSISSTAKSLTSPESSSSKGMIPVFVDADDIPHYNEPDSDAAGEKKQAVAINGLQELCVYADDGWKEDDDADDDADDIPHYNEPDPDAGGEKEQAEAINGLQELCVYADGDDDSSEEDDDDNCSVESLQLD